MPLSQLLDARIELPHREIPPALSYDCAWCGHHVSSDRGVFAKSFCTESCSLPGKAGDGGADWLQWYPVQVPGSPSKL